MSFWWASGTWAQQSQFSVHKMSFSRDQVSSAPPAQKSWFWHIIAVVSHALSGCSQRWLLSSSLPQCFFVLLVFCQFSELNWLMEASPVPETSVYGLTVESRPALLRAVRLSRPLWFTRSWCLSSCLHRRVPGIPEFLQFAAVFPGEWRSRDHAF